MPAHPRSGNDIGAKCATALAALLEKLTVLQTLDLRWARGHRHTNAMDAREVAVRAAAWLECLDKSRRDQKF